MTPIETAKMDRLFNPRHVAIVGGRDAEVVIGECDRIGFKGSVWPVNPKRSDICGYSCFASVEDLPNAPDAAYIAVPRNAAIDVVGRLRKIGCGGIVCYSAGFAETGPAGAAAEAELIKAAGDMPLIGPNCYGLINYIEKSALWPFAHGGKSPGFGAAIITQSGMLSSDITMSQRSFPFAYMVSAGNQAALGLEDFVAYLCEKPEVKAIGLHIEGLRDIAAFSSAANQAAKAGVPIVALKTGVSDVGAALTVSHTGSLSGTDDLYQALFDRLGIIRVTNPSQMLETLKFLCVSGPIKGHRIAGITCSGGGATMLADHGEKIGLEFSTPTEKAAKELAKVLPDIATVSNPLDYTTKIWGFGDQVRPVFDAFFEDPFDSAILVQDYPASGLDESKQLYLNDARAFIAATKEKNIPSAVCCTLAENMDLATREELINSGVSPMQGLPEALSAISAAARYHVFRETFLASGSSFQSSKTDSYETVQLDEAQAKEYLSTAGILVPSGMVTNQLGAHKAAAKIGFPVALKMVSSDLAHKTDAGAVNLGLSSKSEVSAAVSKMIECVQKYSPAALSDQFLIEKMEPKPVAEMLVGIRSDPDFGLSMTIASGGVLVELINDAVTILLPASQIDILSALNKLRISKLLSGFRGALPVDKTRVAQTLQNLADFALSNNHAIAELEINPMFVLPDRDVAVDVLMRVRK